MFTSLIRLLFFYFFFFWLAHRSLSKEALRLNNTLEELDLLGNETDAVAAQALAVMIVENKGLKKLKLNENLSMMTDGLIAIARALKKNQTLEELDLTHCLCLPPVIEEMADSLRINSSLRTLHLPNNNLKDPELLKFADALRVNSTLRFLNLAENLAKDAGVIAFAESLKFNATLTALHLESGNLATSYGVAKLAELLQGNTSLRSLRFDSNAVTLQVAREFSDAILQNRTLTHFRASFQALKQDASAMIHKAFSDTMKFRADVQLKLY